MRPLLLLGVMASALGCTGAIDVPTLPEAPGTPGQPSKPGQPSLPGLPGLPGEPVEPDKCEGVQLAAGPSTLRRLNVAQQLNSYRDVLKDPMAAPELGAQQGPIITEQEVEKLNLAAKALVQRKGHAAYAKCNLDGAINATCADQFISDFGLAVFRRPLEPEEKNGFKTDIYEKLRTDATLNPPATFRELVDSVAEAMLQSPQFLYIHEPGVFDATLPKGFKRLSGFERATRLSYLLWNSAPDAALLAAAGAGTLDTTAGVRAQAERLLADVRARQAVRGVVNGWFELDGSSHQASLEKMPKDKARFPFDSPLLRAAMREEVLALYERAFFEMNGSFHELMTSRKAYVNKSLGALYGVTQGLPANDTTSAWVELDASQRAGLLTRAAFLAIQSPQDVQSPIRRGVFIYREMLGGDLAAAPPNVDNTPIKPTSAAQSTREQVAARTAPSSCQGCHRRINPLGFALENYDAMGRFQTQEQVTFAGSTTTVPIDAKVELIDTDIQGAIGSPLELAAKLGASAQAHDQLVKVWFHRAFERAPVASDACSLQRLSKRFRSSDDMRDLVLALSSDDNALFIQESP